MGLFDFLNKKKKERELQEQLRLEAIRKMQEAERTKRFPWEISAERRAAEGNKAKDSKVHTTGHLLFLKELVSDAIFAYRHVTNTSKYPTYIWAEKELYLGDESKIAYFVPFWWIRSLAKSNVLKFNETMNLLNHEYQINVQSLDIDQLVQLIKRNGFYQFQPGFDVNVNKTLLSKLYLDSECMLRLINFFGDHIKEEDILPSQTKRVNIASASPAVNEVINEMLDAYRKGIFESLYSEKEPNFKEASNSTHTDTFKDVPSAFVTEVTDEDIANGVEDEYGVIYSKDGKRLLKAKKDVFKYYYAEERGTYRIKEGTKVICDNAFSGTLTTTRIDVPFIPGVLVFPHSVIAVGNNAFKGCAIGKFELSQNLLYIGDYAFAGCSIREFTIPSKVTHLGKNPFLYCSCSMNSESNEYIFKDKCLYTCDFKKVISCHITNNETCIEDRGWYTHYESISIADGTIVVGADAFRNCDIGRIDLPATIKIIEKGAFAGTPLFEINIPAGVSIIEDNSFYQCRNLETISLPNTIKDIGDQAFSGCDELTQINIPNTVQSIGDLAFAECKRLKRITIPKNVTHIGGGAFNGCEGCDIYCMSPYFIIKDYALYTRDMRKLTSCFTSDSEFVIPNGVEIIGKHAFEYEYLYRIDIPVSVVTIEQFAMTCKCLRQITIPGNVKSIKDNAFEFSDVEEVTVLEGVETIGNQVFYYCRELKSIKLPQSLNSIGEDAFEDEYNLIPGTIYIPIGTRSKFEELLPKYKNKLKEVENEQ